MGEEKKILLRFNTFSLPGHIDPTVWVEPMT